MSSSSPTSRLSCRSWGPSRSTTARSTPGGTISTLTSSTARWDKAEPVGPMLWGERVYSDLGRSRAGMAEPWVEDEEPGHHAADEDGVVSANPIARRRCAASPSNAAAKVGSYSL